MSREPLTLEELFGEALAARRVGKPVQQGPLRRPEVVRQLPLADTQFYLRVSRVREAEPPPKRPYPGIADVHPNTFPAPHREHCQGKSGGWFDRPWTLEGVRLMLRTGAYFLKGKHEFATRAAAHLALTGEEAAAPPPPTSAGDLTLESLFAEASANLPFKSMSDTVNQ